MLHYDKNILFSVYSANRDNILSILHEIQDKSDENFISKMDIVLLSKYLGLSYGEVYGIATYYGMLSLIKRKKNVIKLCRSPVCRMLCLDEPGSNVLSCLEKNLDYLNGWSIFSLELVECIGHCNVSPCMLINEIVYGNLTSESIKKILKLYISVK